jgi:hypothetical protein
MSGLTYAFPKRQLPKLVNGDNGFEVQSIPGTVPVTGPIAPTGTADAYPSHLALYGKGGLRTVASNTERDAIPTERREEGMLVYVTNTDAYWRWENNSWQSNLKFADGGTKENAAIQVGVSNEGIYYNADALTYNSVDHPAWLTTFSGKDGPGIFDFGIWLPIPPISSNPTNPSSSGYLLWGPLIAGAGLWFASSFRLPSTDAAGKVHSWWGLNWIADGGVGTPQQWFNVSKDYPKQAAQPGLNWTEDSRSYIALGASVNPVAGTVIVPNGTVSLVGLAHQRNFFKTGSANCGFSSLVEDEFSAISEGVEVMRFADGAGSSGTDTGILIRANGAVSRVSVGAVDSGGSGFRVLRIPN